MPTSTSHRVYSDLFEIENFVRQVSVTQGKNLLIDSLREHFGKDTFYRYETDGFGFPLTPNLTDLSPDIDEECTTRIYIGDTFRYDKRYLPAIVVKYASGRYNPVSFNQNQTERYRVDLVIDGYGGESIIRVPTHRVVTGAWDQSFEVLIASESVPDREELTDIVSGYLIGAARQGLYEAGLFLKGVSMSGEREEQFGNDNIYIQSVTAECYSEWRREIPIDSLVETINFCFNYGILGSGNYVTDVTTIDILDAL